MPYKCPVRQKEYKRRKFAAMTPEQRRERKLKQKYGLTISQWDAMFDAQGRACANQLCKRTDPGKRGWHTDHDHDTGKVRAILCFGCNVALGLANDCPDRLRGLADYVEQHNEARSCRIDLPRGLGHAGARVPRGNRAEHVRGQPADVHVCASDPGAVEGQL